MELVFASNNKHKIQEIKQLLPETFEIVRKTEKIKEKLRLYREDRDDTV